MREGFEKNLRAFGKDIVERELPADEVSREEIENLEMIEVAAQEMGTETSTQVDVYFKQKKKQEIMDNLHERLQELDAIHERARARPGASTFESVGEKGGKMVYARGEGDTVTYFLRGKKNANEIPITEGDMLTDGMWGVSYRMDASVPRSVAKQYLVGSAKQQLYDLLDEQITVTEKASDVNQGSGLDDAYAAMERRQEGEEEDPNGILAERMTQSFLLKLTYDHDVPFEILRADAELDAEDKIDFIVRIRGVHNRGVDVKVGVQFTTSVKQATIRKKEKQIEQVNKRLGVEDNAPVHDVVLVSIPIHETHELYDQWNTAKQRSPGGPDSLWSTETKRLVFEGVLQKLHHIIPEDEIASLWNAIEAKLPK